MKIMYKKGLSLIEVVLALGLLAILGIIVNMYFSATLRSARKAASMVTVKNEGEYLMTSLVGSVKFAKRINSCTATSLNILASDGADATFAVSSNQMVITKVYPLPTPTIVVQLTTARTVVTGSGECSGTIFTCVRGGATVGVCFSVNNAAGADVSDITGITYKTQLVNAN